MRHGTTIFTGSFSVFSCRGPLQKNIESFSNHPYLRDTLLRSYSSKYYVSQKLLHQIVAIFKRNLMSMLYLFYTLLEPLSHFVIVLLFFFLWSLMSERWGGGSEVPRRLHYILRNVWVDIPVIGKIDVEEKVAIKPWIQTRRGDFPFFFLQER